jgi:hypothetical protein
MDHNHPESSQLKLGSPYTRSIESNSPINMVVGKLSPLLLVKRKHWSSIVKVGRINWKNSLSIITTTYLIIGTSKSHYFIMDLNAISACDDAVQQQQQQQQQHLIMHNHPI